MNSLNILQVKTGTASRTIFRELGTWVARWPWWKPGDPVGCGFSEQAAIDDLLEKPWE